MYLHSSSSFRINHMTTFWKNTIKSKGTLHFRHDHLKHQSEHLNLAYRIYHTAISSRPSHNYIWHDYRTAISDQTTAHLYFSRLPHNCILNYYHKAFHTAISSTTTAQLYLIRLPHIFIFHDYRTCSYIWHDYHTAISGTTTTHLWKFTS